MKKIISLSLFVILAVSGCTSLPFIGGGISAGNGLVIEEFKTDFSEVKAGEPFKIMLKVRNKGTSFARNVVVDLSNSEELQCMGGCNFYTPISPPDPESGTEGESRTCTWNCRAPYDIPYGMSVTYNPLVRITYQYTSDIVRTITLASQDEVRNLQDMGRSLSIDPVSTSSGPVSLDLKLHSPVRYWMDQGLISSPMSIDIMNTGGGITCYPDCFDQNGWNKISIYSQNFLGDILIDECDVGIGSPITLWEGKSRTIRCNLQIMNMPMTFGQTKKTINMKAEYYYMVTANTAVKAAGTEENPLY
ncbi:MAG: hypothetical protein JW754_05510 [Candidatus Aenigmarchaeota archaeon]|nr:hypothetical protein [Candidatus Aenigmarchaeota archaeon]